MSQPVCRERSDLSSDRVKASGLAFTELCPILQGHLQLSKEVVGQQQVALPVQRPRHDP